MLFDFSLRVELNKLIDTMKEEIAISLKGVSKKYPIYESPIHRLKEAIWRGKKSYHRQFWALQNIDLEVPRGVTLGILGQNGSGKSTLLQIIAGIMEPSGGKVRTRGRISTILELGAGFNPDFTGRENVFLSGHILGIFPSEMKKRFASIVSFAEIGEFIDQPVKTYSTGMYVRLAFAVAINLDPDILLVDEVMAVGDTYFQHKCMRKIRDFQEEGRTIIYVTHDVESVRNLCHRAMILDFSQIMARGDPGDVANQYMALIDAREKIHFEVSPEEAREILNRKDFQPYFDFYQEFERAEKQAPYLNLSPELLAPTQYPAAAGSFPSILAHPQSILTYDDVKVAPDSVLAVGMGLLPECWDKPGKGVLFRIAARSGGEEKYLLEEWLDPQNKAEDRKILIREISLQQYSGRNVTFKFITSGRTPEAKFSWACWISPQLASSRTGAPGAADEVEPQFSSYSRYGRREAEITKIEIMNGKEEAVSSFRAGEEIVLRFHVRFNSDVSNFVIGNIFRNKWGLNVYGMNTEWYGLPDADYKQGDRIVVTFRHRLNLADGTYSLNPATSSTVGKHLYKTLDWINNAAIIRVTNPRRMEGYVSLPCQITVSRLDI